MSLPVLKLEQQFSDEFNADDEVHCYNVEDMLLKIMITYFIDSFHLRTPTLSPAITVTMNDPLATTQNILKTHTLMLTLRCFHIIAMSSTQCAQQRSAVVNTTTANTDLRKSLRR